MIAQFDMSKKPGLLAGTKLLDDTGRDYTKRELFRHIKISDRQGHRY